MGVNPTAAYLDTNYGTMSGTTYPLQIDANFQVLTRLGDTFAPHAQGTPNMTIALDAGFLLSGTTLTEVASQNTGTITAPVSHPRIDRAVIDQGTGAVSVVTGTEAVSPSPPAIPSGKFPVAQILLQTTSTSITNSMITDERALVANTSGAGTVTNVSSSDSGHDITHTIVNPSTTPTISADLQVSARTADIFGDLVSLNGGL